jgi:hypothetical protein
LKGYDAAVLMEVIEHVDPPRLAALEHAVFGTARPRAVVVTTPNAEYTVRYETLEAGRMRHRDHRFEWTRAEFAAWAEGVAERRGYVVELRPVGEVDAELGPPTQLALFAEITGPTSAQDAPVQASKHGEPGKFGESGESCESGEFGKCDESGESGEPGEPDETAPAKEAN